MRTNNNLLTAFVLVLVLLAVVSGCRELNEQLQKQNTRQLYFGIAVAGLPSQPDVFQSKEKDTGLPVSMVNFFLQWPQDPEELNFPGKTLEAVHSFGAMAVLTWEPMYYDQHGREHMIRARDIVQGRYDHYIDGFASRIRDLEYPVIIRFAHEMNLERYHWGGSREEYGPESPGRYRDMFRYVAQRFDKAGAENALFAFCPNAESLPSPQGEEGAEWNRAENYYPGDEYVDVLGMDGYNWGKTHTLEEHGWQSRWQSFEEIFEPVYQELRSISRYKPLFVFETAAPQEGGDRDLWVRKAFETAREWGLQGIFWFQVDKEANWRLRAGDDCKYPGEVRRQVFSPLPLFDAD